jgi:integrase/recombinase XerD
MFEQFIKERYFLHNVSPRTIEWYRESFKWLVEPTPTKAHLKSFVIRMREKGLKASSCNNRIRAVNAYLQWSESDLRVDKLKEPHLVLPVFSVEDIKKIVAWKPKSFYERRLYTLMLMLADTGCRIDEVLTLKWSDVDFDNLLLTVTGKGDKQRTIPYSFELRKHLFRFKHEHQLVFPTKRGRKLGRRDVLRDVKRTCRKLGVEPPVRTLHAMRHTMASNFIKRGGNVALLQRVLGHSSITTTMRYVHLQTEDLQAVHQRVSLLAA